MITKSSATKEQNELQTQVIEESFTKMRQLNAEKKKLRDREKVMFTKLAQHGIAKKEFMEAWRRHDQPEKQLDMFDQATMRIEKVMRDIVGENVTEEKHDQPEPGEKTEKAAAGKKAAKKAAKAPKAKAAEGKKKVDVASPENLPGKVVPIGAPRTSNRKAVAGRAVPLTGPQPGSSIAPNG